jgi:hypothetical protein
MSPCRSDYIFTDTIIGVWHVVSEDSDHFTAWPAVVHRLHDLDNFEQPTRCEVRASLDHSHTPYEPLEVETLRGSQRVTLKERNYLLKKIAPSADNKLIEVFFVVVVSAVAMQTPHSEVPLHHSQTLHALRALCNYELVRHLETSLVAPPICSMGCRQRWIEKHPSPSTKPVIQPISLSC